jgi:hypothetical protein
MNCHMLGGKGSPVGPALDGISARKDAAYITQSLVEPNAVLAENYTATPVSPDAADGPDPEAAGAGGHQGVLEHLEVKFSGLSFQP